jgi:sugar phosphate isomerase/epimerase
MRRREFLSTVAAVPITGFQIDQKASTTATPRRGLRLGTVTYNIARDWDLPTLIKNLSDARFEAVELRTTHTHGVEIALPAAARADVKKRFEESAVKLGGLGTTCEYHSPDAAVLRRNIDETREWVTLARDIGSPGVKVRPNGVPKEVPEEKTLEQIGRALRECGTFARDHGVAIQLEVHGQTTSRLSRIRKILDYADNHPGVRVCWNSNPEDLLDGGFDANFALVRDQIGQVHMRDLYVEEYPWRRLFAALSDMKFDGYCFAEIPESTDPTRVLRYFRSLFRAYQGL